MTLTKLLEVQQGKRSLRLFRASETDALFVAVDKTVGARTIKSPLLSERDLRCFIDIVNRHKAKRREWVRLRAGKFLTGGTKIPGPATYDPAIAQLEIEEAIRRTRERRPEHERGRITVIPSMPKYTYCHTCSICGCHIEAHLRLGPGTALKLCPNCEHVHAATE